MGIPTLWQYLEPTSSSATLVELAWKEGFDNPDGSRHLRLGIDASIWLFQVEKANSDYPLHALFYRLATFLRLPILPLFVFDGDARPKVKRGKSVPRGGTMKNERAFKEMIQAFGFDSWTAPGEAEAELALLSSEGRLDAVQTEDVDALVFGAAVVYVSSKSKKGYLLEFDVYNLIDLEEVHDISHASLILAAILMGGDYDPGGSKSLGPKKALALGRAGFAQKMYDAFTSLSRADFVHHFSPQFRVEVAEELRTNSTGLLGMKFKANADLIAASSTFPDVVVLEQYIRPITSASPGRQAWPGFQGREARGALDGVGLAGLGKVMERTLGWEGKDAVLKRGSSRIWEGAVRRALQQELEHPGTWTKDCTNLGLVSLLSSPKDYRIEDFYDPSTSTSFRSRSPGSSDDEKKAKAEPQMFGESYPFLLSIKKKRLHANTSRSLEEYQCVFDPSRFNAEAVKGLTNGGILEPEDVKPRFSSSQPQAGPSTFGSKGRTPGRRLASNPEMDEDDEDEDMKYAKEQSLIAEKSHRDGDFRPRGEPADATIVDEQDEDDEDSSSSPSAKSKVKKPTPPFDPTAPVVVWVPALLLQLTHPDKIAEFEEAVASKEKKKADLLAAKEERARVREAKKKQTEQAVSLMDSWVTKVAKPRPKDKAKGKAKEVARASSSSAEPARAGSAAPSRNSSKGSAPPPDASIIEISDESDADRKPPIPKSPSPKRTFRRVLSDHLDRPPVASSSQQPPAPIKSKTRPLRPFPSTSSTSSISEQPPSKLQKRSPLKRTLSALSASTVPDLLSDDEEEDGFPLDAFNADNRPAFGLATPEKKRRVRPPTGAYSPAKRLEPMRSLSPSPASKLDKGKGRASADAGLSRKAVVQDISDSDDDIIRRPVDPPHPSSAFSSPPPRPRPRALPGKRTLGSLPPQSRPSRPLAKADVFDISSSSSPVVPVAPVATRAKTFKKPVYVEMDSD